MQQKFSPDMINGVYDPINFYTYYKNCPGKFKFPFGHKELLVKAANYCKNVVENIQHRTSLNVMSQQKEEKFVVPIAKEKIFRKIGDQMISAFNDAKRCTLSAWSYPSMDKKTITPQNLFIFLIMSEKFGIRLTFLFITFTLLQFYTHNFTDFTHLRT